MSIFYPPIPPVFTGGSQPYGQSQINPYNTLERDNPPGTYAGPTTLQQSLIQFAQPNPWVYAFSGAIAGNQPYGNRQLNPALLASVLSPVPNTYAGPTVIQQEIVQFAQPNPWVYVFTGAIAGDQPYGNRQLNPGVIAGVLSPVPHVYAGPTVIQQAIVQLAQPNPWVYAYSDFSRQPYGLLEVQTPGFTPLPPPGTFGGPTQAQQLAVYLNQPPIWPYVFGAGPQPYGGHIFDPKIQMLIQRGFGRGFIIY